MMGFDSRNALSLGVLLNTRGLVELVVLNVGLDLNADAGAVFDDGGDGFGDHFDDYARLKRP